MSPTPFLLALFSATILGGLLPLFVRESSRVLHLLLCMAAGFLLGTVFLHLLPELTHVADGDLSVWTWVLLGLLAVLVLDLGIFGHQSHAAVGWATLLGLGLHAATMGMSLGMLPEISVILAWGLLAHKFGETFSLVSAMRLSVRKRSLLIVVLIGFAFVTPLAMLLGEAIREAVPDGFGLVISALAAGTFLYVAVGDILPEVFHDSRDRGSKIVLLLLGTAFAALVGLGGHAHEGHAEHAASSAALGSAAGLGHVDKELAVGLPAEFVLALFSQAWAALVAVAPFLLLGFLIAGLIKVYLPKDFLSRALGKDDLPSILRASLIGAPLPLCSCSVLPTAMGLRENGASKSATVSFLVSTPETGIDSIAVSAALLDPYLTVARPLAAVVSATAAGLASRHVVRAEARVRGAVESAEAVVGETPKPDPGSQGAQPASCCAQPSADKLPQHGHFAQFRAACAFGFGKLFSDIVPSLLLGIVLAALFSLLLPAELLAGTWARGYGGLFAAALFGLPIYVCASASTPIAAVFLAKGLSPGAGLVFLMLGPATNLASILVLRKALGTRVVLAYLSAVVLVALCLGALTNMLYGAWDLAAPAGDFHENGASLFGTVSAIFLLGLAAWSFLRQFRRGDNCDANDDVAVSKAHGSVEGASVPPA